MSHECSSWWYNFSTLDHRSFWETKRSRGIDRYRVFVLDRKCFWDVQCYSLVIDTLRYEWPVLMSGREIRISYMRGATSKYVTLIPRLPVSSLCHRITHTRIDTLADEHVDYIKTLRACSLSILSHDKRLTSASAFQAECACVYS